VLTAELGAGPLALARAQRAQAARTLIETTSLPMADVAFAAGFSSIRQFNDTVRSVFALTPRELRRRAGSIGASRDSLSLRLPFRQPLSQDNLFKQLADVGPPNARPLLLKGFAATWWVSFPRWLRSQADHVRDPGS
jgi:AraC family transcriptional regulator of adaptative response / DNA-3-methyladenine glycosylase II